MESLFWMFSYSVSESQSNNRPTRPPGLEIATLGVLRQLQMYAADHTRKGTFSTSDAP